MFNSKLKKEIRDLREELAAARQEKYDMTEFVVEASGKLSQEIKKSRSLEEERDKLKKLVREQTGADLLVNALESLGITGKEDDKKDYFAEQQRLNQMAASAQNNALSGGGAQYSGMEGTRSFLSDQLPFCRVP